METIAKITRAFFVEAKSIKQICRDLRLSRNAVRKVVRSGDTEFSYDRLGAGVLNDPAESVVWLAQRMAQYGKRSIEPGQIILSGSFICLVECPSGSEIFADFGPFVSAEIAFA